MRDVFDDVQAALEAGASRETVRQELARHGLDMSLRTFDRTLARIRQAHGIRRGKHAAPPVPTEQRPPTGRAIHATRVPSGPVNAAPNAHDAIPRPSSSSTTTLPDD
ncbi:hypothetical protein [Burkholderia cepacia]|uniref:hypothetical protein n=1 Tax=Burkholderia cepacia TaxID=292 RepID=UPI00158B35C3|nr:hypothetical protein [Burkholderia cepacia]